MPKVKYRKARKAIESIGVKPGDMYYKWSMRTATGGVTRVSKTPPRPSQLTLSEFKSQWRAFAEEIDDLAVDEDLYDNLQEIAGRIRDLGNEQEEKLSNMPDGLQQGGTGELLQTRKDNCETWADAIEGLSQPSAPDEEAIKAGVEREEGQTDQQYLAAQEEKWSEAKEQYQGELESLKEEAASADPGEE